MAVTKNPPRQSSGQADKKISVKTSKSEVSNDFAVIKTGGKQYIVTSGMKLEVEKLDKTLGEEVIFNEILLVSKNGEVTLGAPFIDGARVTAISEGEKRLKKVRIVKFKSKVRYHKTQGHRQTKTLVTIREI